MSQDDWHDLPDLNEGEALELHGGDTLEESEDAPSPFREIEEEEMEQGRLLGAAIDTDDDESGSDLEEG